MSNHAILDNKLKVKCLTIIIRQTIKNKLPDFIQQVIQI